MLAGSPLWTTMSTCAWTGTTLQLKTGWKYQNPHFDWVVTIVTYFQGQSWSRNHFGWGRRILSHKLLKILSGPDKEVSGPLQETSRAWKVWPHHWTDQHPKHEASTGMVVIYPILCQRLHNLDLFLPQTFSGKCTGVAFPVHHHYVNRTGECVPK